MEPSGKKHVALTACEMEATYSKTVTESSAMRAVDDNNPRPPIGSVVGPFLGSQECGRTHDSSGLENDEVEDPAKVCSNIGTIAISAACR